MSFNSDIAAIRERLAAARAARDGCQAAGRREQYLRACGMVESLETELERLRRQGLRSLSVSR